MRNREEISFVEEFLEYGRKISFANISTSIEAAKLCNEEDLKLLLPYIDALVCLHEDVFEDYYSFWYLCDTFYPELFDTLYELAGRKSCLSDDLPF